MLESVLSMTIEQVCEAIEWDPKELAGNCHAVSTAIVRSGIAGPRARVARGHYKGYTGQHTWVIIPDDDAGDTVVDAAVNGVKLGRGKADLPELFIGTKWDVLDIFTCEICGTLEDDHPFYETGLDICDDFVPDHPPWPYDEGGDELREVLNTGAPEPQGDTVEFALSSDIRQAVALNVGLTVPWHPNQVAWLMSRSVREVGGDWVMRGLVTEAARQGFGWAIPIDRLTQYGEPFNS